MPYGAMPVLEVDGRQLTQSNAINRYVGKLANLYPTDPWQAAVCDEVMDAVEDIGQQIAVTFPMKDAAEKKAARERLAAGPISLYLSRLHTQLQQRGMLCGWASHSCRPKSIRLDPPPEIRRAGSCPPRTWSSASAHRSCDTQSA